MKNQNDFEKFIKCLTDSIAESQKVSWKIVDALLTEDSLREIFDYKSADESIEKFVSKITRMVRNAMLIIKQSSPCEEGASKALKILKADSVV